MKKAHNPGDLYAHEWLAIVCFMGIMIFLTFISHKGPFLVEEEPFYPYDQEIVIYVGGAVENPGTYKLKRGDTVQNALDLAKPLADADLRRIRPQTKLRNGHGIKIPKREMYTVHVAGAVKNPGALVLPKGTRVQDLLALLQLNEDADPKYLQKKRYIKDGERFAIPLKK